MYPNRIILIRHGESEGNKCKGIYDRKPDYALKLTAKGRRQAEEAGLKLMDIVGRESLCFYVSPHFRTRQTFKEILKVMPATQQHRSGEEPRLREQEWGHYRSEMDGAQIDRDRDEYGTFYYRIPDGESAADVYDRVSDFFGTLFRDFEKKDFPDNAVMVTHGMTIRLFLMRWCHWTVEEFERKKNPKNCEIFVLERQNDGKYRPMTQLLEGPVKHSWRMED